MLATDRSQLGGDDFSEGRPPCRPIPVDGTAPVPPSEWRVPLATDEVIVRLALTDDREFFTADEHFGG